jgi:hypothetical protein
MLNLKQSIEERINGFVHKLQTVITEHYVTKYPNIGAPVITVDWGRKYARIVKETAGQKMVHSFIDLSNGDILKAASWAAPAKRARGSVFDDNYGVGSAVNVYSAQYLR